jgi:hypothetical protein
MQVAMKNPNDALAGSYDFMHLFGHTVVGLMWARMALVAKNVLKSAPSDAAFYETKLKTARYYMARQLPATAMHLARIQSGSATVMGLGADEF